ncbi:MAG: hypothetical protein SNH79_06925 [Rikenellaceae bacterium]
MAVSQAMTSLVIRLVAMLVLLLIVTVLAIRIVTFSILIRLVMLLLHSMLQIVLTSIGAIATRDMVALQPTRLQIQVGFATFFGMTLP